MIDSYRKQLSLVKKPLVTAESTSFWRMEQPEFEEDTLVSGGFWEHQMAFWKLNTFIKALVGGYGSGKTLVGSKRIISLALENAPCPVAAVSPTYGMARDTTIATVEDLLEGKRHILGRSFSWRFNKSTSRFHIKYRGRDATILIYSGERPQTLKGPNLAAIWIDEPFIQEEEVFTQMIARARHPLAIKKEIILTGTPEQLNWGYDLCVGDKKDSYDVSWIQAGTQENKALGADYVTRLQSAFTDKAGEAFIGGGFVNLASGLVYYQFNTDMICDLEMPPSAILGCGMDFNVNPMSMVVFWRAGNHVHVIDEFELPNADTEYACQVLREEHPDCTTIYPDATGSSRRTSTPTGRSDHWFIRKAGYDLLARNSNPKRKDRYNAVNTRFQSILGENNLTLSPNCTKLAKYLNLYSHELMDKQEKLSHLLDAFSYPIAYLFPVDRPPTQKLRVTGH